MRGDMSDQSAVEQPAVPPRADAEESPGEGTGSGNPVAGVELDRDAAPEVVSGDTGPEGNRQTSLAPPI